MNIFAIIGNLTADPELTLIPKKDGSGDIEKAEFSIAWNNPRVKDREDPRSASFFNVELWGSAARSFVEWHKKGDRVCLHGEIHQERWEKDGQKRSTVKLKAQSFTNVKTHRDNDGPASSGSSENKQAVNTDEIPF